MTYLSIEYCNQCDKEIAFCDCVCNECGGDLHDCECEEK